MDLREAKIIPDTRVYAEKHVSKEHGRKRLEELERRGVIAPTKTATGRRWLSFEDAKRLAAAL